MGVIAAITSAAQRVDVRAAVALVVTGMIGKWVVGSVLRARTCAWYETAVANRSAFHLFVMPRLSSTLSLSGPCLKAEIWLRLAKIPYTAHFSSSTGFSPNGCLPMAEFDATKVADSEFIIAFTKKQDLGDAVKLDEALTPEQAAVGHAFAQMTEGDTGRGIYRAAFVDNMPHLVGGILLKEFGDTFIKRLGTRLFAPKFRQRIITSLNASGHGNLSDDQYTANFINDIKAIETQLAQSAKSGSDFLLGTKRPTSYDASVVSRLFCARTLANLIPAGSSECLDYIRSSAAIDKYVSTVMDLAFPDAAACCAARKAPSAAYPALP